MKKNRFRFGEIGDDGDKCEYVYDSDDDITYYNETVDDFKGIVKLLNDLNEEINYLKIILIGAEFVSKTTGATIKSTEERFKFKKNFPSYVMDTETSYGQYNRLMNVRECTLMLNKLYNENIILSKKDGDGKLIERINELIKLYSEGDENMGRDTEMIRKSKLTLLKGLRSVIE